jgi:transposase
MSTSLLYHGFGIRGYEHVRTYYEEGGIIFKIRQQRNELRCPRCGSRDVTCRGQVERPFKSLPIGLKPVSILLAIQRVWCVACDVVRQVRIGFADQRRSYTRSFERYALELLRHMTIQDVAQHLGVSWDVIKDIEKRNLKKRFSRPKLRKLKRIAIDEISIGRGHQYLTIVLDLITGVVVFVGDGKGSDALAPFWTKLKRSRAKIKAVAIDMSPAYISAVTENLKEATIVFDHFHVIKLFNEKLSDLRRTLYHQALTQQEKHVIKGTRWLLLKNPDNLDETRNESQRLHEALALNQPLATAYYLKEDLRQLWSYPNKKEAKTFLKDWVARARASGIKMLVKFANTLIAHASGILAYYNFRISTGPLEGTNNKIKVMKRQAYGFRDMEFFKLKIMAIHQSKYALVG